MNDILNKKRIGHAYLLVSKNRENAIEKAKKFSYKLLGTKNLENNPDFNILETEEKTLKIEEIREFQKDVLVKPINEEYKIYIILDADKMTSQAQNAILKTLEEPPSYIIIILVATFAEKLLPTIISRVERINIEGERKKNEYKKAKEFIDNINNLTEIEALGLLEYFNDNKDDILNILEYMLNYSKELLEEFILSDSQKNDNMNSNRLVYYIEIINNSISRLERNCNFNMTIDYLILNIFHCEGVKDID